jgi:hypothetical protein
MAAHRKPGKLFSLTAAAFLLMTAAVGGYALAGNRVTELADSHAPQTVRLASPWSASGQHVTVTACLASGKLSPVSVAALKCPATSATLRWAAQSGPAGASGQHMNVTACLASGKLSHVSVAALKCPANSATLRWTAQSSPASSPSPLPSRSSPSSPVPTSTSPSPSPTSTSPSPPSPRTGAPCSVSGTNDYCPAPGVDYSYAPDDLSNGSNNYINTDIFSPLPGFTSRNCAPGSATPCQTVNAFNPGDWSATANYPAGNTGIVSAPQDRTDLGYQPVSGFHSLTASFSDNINANGGTDAEAAYDFWSSTSSGNAFSQEMMVWTDSAGRGTCGGGTVIATGVTFPGNNAGPWNLCVNGPLNSGSEFIWYLPGMQQPNNKIDVLGMFNYMISHGYYSAATGINQIVETAEIASTGGQYETFQFSNLAISHS